MILRILGISMVILIVQAMDWTIDVEYTLSDGDRYDPLGSIALHREMDGNYTGRFTPASAQLAGDLKQKFIDAVKNGRRYRYRTGGGKADSVSSWNKPCFFLLSSLGHHFAVTIDSDRQLLHSLIIQPLGLNQLPDDEPNCEGIRSEQLPNIVRTRVEITDTTELPSPDTASYLQKMDKERQARQHGAQQDNRSFLAKYWMYIVPVVIFLAFSSIMNQDQGGEQG